MSKFLVLVVALCAFAQQPEPLSVTRFFNIRSSASVIDNRNSVTRQNDYHSFCATGTGTWSVSIQYASSSSGPWTTFSTPTATVTSTSSDCYGSGYGYKPFIRFSFTGTATVNYSASKNYYIVSQNQGAFEGLSYTKTFTSTTSLSIPSSEHGFSTANLLVTCQDGSGGSIEPNQVTIATNGDITITFVVAQAGSCEVGGSSTSYSKSITNASSVSIPASEHQLRTITGAICLDASNFVIQTGAVTFTPAVLAVGGSMSASYDVTIAFAIGQTGRCALLGV